MIKTCLKLEMLPDAAGYVCTFRVFRQPALTTCGKDINWIPTNAVAGAVVDLVHVNERLPLTINLSHPRPIPWTEMMKYFAKAFAEHGYPEITIVPWPEWFEELTTYQRLGLTQGLVSVLLLYFPEHQSHQCSSSETASAPDHGIFHRS
jgi:hypothetical protein